MQSVFNKVNRAWMPYLKKKGLKEVVMLVTKVANCPGNPEKETCQGINQCLCIQSADPCITTGHEQWQETREETGAVRRNGHPECQTGRFEERMQHTGNIYCTVNSSRRNCCRCKKAISWRGGGPVSVTIHSSFALVCSLLSEASLTTSRARTLPIGSFFKPFLCRDWIRQQSQFA